MNATQARFEYKYVRLAEGWLVAKKKTRGSYQEVIDKHAAEGWKLVQIFAPGTGAYGAARYYEVILERPLQA